MGKIKKFEFQIENELKKETKYGQSKHEAKRLAREEAKRTGKPYQQPRGIYSTKTYYDYKESCLTFSRYCIKHHSEVRRFSDCQKYAAEYIRDCRERERTEWTNNKYAYAIACAYHTTPEELGIEKGVRARKDIKRDRNAENNKYRQQEKYKDVVHMATATGARHAEILRLRKEDFRENEDGTMSVFRRGKNGIERWCLVNPIHQDWVKEYINSKETIKVNDEERLFRKDEAPTRLPLHDCRATYASNLYDYYEKAGFASGDIYHCRGDLAGYSYDKGILSKVSYDLAHGRNNVVVDYLWQSR